MYVTLGIASAEVANTNGAVGFIIMQVVVLRGEALEGGGVNAVRNGVLGFPVAV